MKVVWEDEDINPGVVVGKKDRKERWIIGYDPTGATGANFALISLSDGMVSKKMMMPGTLAKFLNETGDLPVALIMDARLNGKIG